MGVLLRALVQRRLWNKCGSVAEAWLGKIRCLLEVIAASMDCGRAVMWHHFIGGFRSGWSRHRRAP